ncbi:MAG: hypothetical protein M3340_06825 [Actinomycetota bacterium]|nr:hypothetical protein [Actinomycetota bacterium]
MFRLEEVADRYRAKGYEVVLEPGPERLPAFLGNYRPDLLATRGSENVVVEVKTRDALEQEVGLSEVARLLEAHPGWRMDIVSLPRREGTRTDLMDPATLTTLINEAKELSRNGLGHPAVLLSWTVLEGALRHALADADPADRPLTSLSLLKTALSLGHLDQREFNVLSDLAHLRNRVAHGFQTNPAQLSVVHATPLVDAVEAVVPRLLDAGTPRAGERSSQDPG